MKFTSIIPADNWYYRYKKADPSPSDIYHTVFCRIVCWGITEEGEVIGLTGMSPGAALDGESSPRNSLMTPPPLQCHIDYVHWDEMTEEDRKAAMRWVNSGFEDAE